MKRFLTFLTLFFLILSLHHLVWAADQSQGGPSTAEVIGDVLWLRPLGFIRTVLEGAAYVVSYPVTKPMGKVDGAQEFLINDPYYFTFERPLGEM